MLVDEVRNESKFPLEGSQEWTKAALTAITRNRTDPSITKSASILTDPGTKAEPVALTLKGVDLKGRKDR